MAKAVQKKVIEKKTVKKNAVKKNIVKNKKNVISKTIKEYVDQKLKNVENRIDGLESEYVRDYVLIGNLVIDVKKNQNKAEHVLRREAKLLAVYNFLDIVLGSENYLKDLVTSVDYFKNKNKGVLKVKLGSNLIDKVIENYQKFQTVKSSKKNEKVWCERLKSSSQVKISNEANILRKRLIDFFYIQHGGRVSDMPSVYSRNGKIKIANELLSIEDVKNHYNIDYTKSLDGLHYPYGKRVADEMEEA